MTGVQTCALPICRPMPAHHVPDYLSAVVPPADDTELLVPMSLELRAHRLAEACESDAAAIAFMDPAGTVVASSTAFDKTMDVEKGAAAGRHIWELIGVTPDTIAELRANDLLDQEFPELEKSTANGSMARILIRPVKDESSELLGYSVEFNGSQNPNSAGVVS